MTTKSSSDTPPAPAETETSSETHSTQPEQRDVTTIPVTSGHATTTRQEQPSTDTDSNTDTASTTETQDAATEADGVIQLLSNTDTFIRIPNRIETLDITLYYADFCIVNGAYFERVHRPPIGTSRWVSERSYREGRCEERIKRLINNDTSYEIGRCDPATVTQHE